MHHVVRPGQLTWSKKHYWMPELLWLAGSTRWNIRVYSKYLVCKQFHVRSNCIPISHASWQIIIGYLNLLTVRVYNFGNFISSIKILSMLKVCASLVVSWVVKKLALLFVTAASLEDLLHSGEAAIILSHSQGIKKSTACRVSSISVSSVVLVAFLI